MKYSYQRIGRHLDFLDRLPPFPVLFVSLLLCCMFPTMSTATTQWIFVTSLNSTLCSLLRYAFVARKTCKIMYSFIVPNKCGPITRSTPHPLLHIAPVLSFALLYSSTIHSQAQSHIVQPDIRNLPDCR